MHTGERAWLSVGRTGLLTGEALKAVASSSFGNAFLRTVEYHSA